MPAVPSKSVDRNTFMIATRYAIAAPAGARTRRAPAGHTPAMVTWVSRMRLPDGSRKPESMP